MRNQRRVPRLFWPFAVLTMFGPLGIMLLQHDPIHAKPVGIAFVAILLVAIMRGSLVCWTLVFLWNAFLVSAAASALSHLGLATVSAPLLPLLGLSCAALQMAPSMRHHVGLRRGEDARQGSAAPL